MFTTYTITGKVCLNQIMMLVGTMPPQNFWKRILLHGMSMGCKGYRKKPYKMKPLPPLAKITQGKIYPRLKGEKRQLPK